MGYGSYDLHDRTNQIINAVQHTDWPKQDICELIKSLQQEYDNLSEIYQDKIFNKLAIDSCANNMKSYQMRPMTLVSTKIADILIKTLYLANRLNVNSECSLSDKINYTDWKGV